LTKQWQDWVDYWAVDFNFENKKEIIRIKTNESAKDEANRYDQIWTGNYVFENDWQSFRTKKNPQIEMTTVPHTYEKSGKYKAVVKIIDILGVDTTQVLEIKID